MAANASGAGSRIGLKREATDGVKATGDYHGVSVISAAINTPGQFLQNDLIGQGRDAERQDEDVADTAGTIVIPVDYRAIGHWLTMLLGPPTSSASGGGFNHLWKSGADALPSYSIERQQVDTTPKMYFLTTGVKGQSFSLQVLPRGAVQMSIPIMASRTVRSTTSGAGTLANVEIDRFLQKQSFVKKDGTDLGRVPSVQLDYANNLTGDPYVGGGGAIGGTTLGKVAVTGQLVSKLWNFDLFDEVDSRAGFPLDFGYEAENGYKLTFSVADTLLISPNWTTQAGPQDVTFDLAGAKTATNSALEVTLLNDVASYA